MRQLQPATVVQVPHRTKIGQQDIEERKTITMEEEEDQAVITRIGRMDMEERTTMEEETAHLVIDKDNTTETRHGQ